MIRCGKHGTVYVVSFVKHELRKDQEVTLFSISDFVQDRDGNPAKLANGKIKKVFMQVTSWEELPIVDGDRIKMEYITDIAIFEMKNKAGYLQTYYSLTAKIEIVT